MPGGGLIPSGPSEVPVPSLALVVLDGWGLAPPGPGNAISLADTPVFDELWERYPRTQLSASGRDVGLPDGQMGNSEVGHLNLGAGTVVKQDLARIDDAIADGSFFENPVLLAACEAARNGPRGRLHLMGLVSDGGVHSGWEHIEACIELAAQQGVPDLVVHAFTDGRDTLPKSSPGYIAEVERWLRRAGRIGTVGGRYYAMDRDRRWERVKLAYDAIVHAEGLRAATALEAVADSHERGETDEFIRPTVIGDYDGMEGGDAVIHFNFRPDRARELVTAIGDPDFGEFTARAGAGRLPGDDDAVPRRLGVPGRVPAPAAEDHPRGGARRARRAPAPRRRDREVRTRHLLLQRRPRGGVGGRGALPGGLAARRADLRPQARDERAGGGGLVRRALARGRLPVRDHQLRQPGHGRPHRLDPRGGGRDRGRGLLPARRGVAPSTSGAAPASSPPTTATPTTCSSQMARRTPPTRLNPVPFVVTVPGLELADGGILADVAPTALALLGIPQPEAMTGRSLARP